MKARVIESTCIGCGACQALVPDEFEINDLGNNERKVTIKAEDNFIKKIEEEINNEKRRS